MRSEKIAFLGGGNMAEAILGGLLAGGVSMEKHLVVADIAAAGGATETLRRVLDVFEAIGSRSVLS